MFDSTSRSTLLVAALIGGLALFVAGFIIALEVRSTVASPPEEQKTYGPGWLNMAHVGATQAIGEALSGIESNVGVVYYLNPDTGAWLRYVPSKPEVSNLTTMEFGQSYLVLLTGLTTMTVPTEQTFLATPTPCPGCPAATNLMSDRCTGYKADIELNEVLLEIAQEGLLVGRTVSEVQADIDDYQQYFDQNCAGIPLAEPLWLAASCANTAMFFGMQETTMLYAPSARDQAWADQFDNILDKYCFSQ